jgi:hypothetical protein
VDNNTEEDEMDPEPGLVSDYVGETASRARRAAYLRGFEDGQRIGYRASALGAEGELILTPVCDPELTSQDQLDAYKRGLAFSLSEDLAETSPRPTRPWDGYESEAAQDAAYDERLGDGDTQEELGA